MSNKLERVFAVAAQHGIDTSQLAASYEMAEAFLDTIGPALATQFPPATLPGVEILVIGSIAKRQCTQGSDLDFFGIVDEPLDKEITDPIVKAMFDQARTLGFELPFASGPMGVFVPREEIEKVDVIKDITPKRFRRMTMLTGSVSVYRPDLRAKILHGVLDSFLGRNRTPRIIGVIDYLIINTRLSSLVADWMHGFPPPEGGHVGWAKCHTIYRIERASAMAAIIRAECAGGSRDDLIDAIVRELDRTPLERFIAWYDELGAPGRGAVATMIAVSNDSLRLLAADGVRNQLALAVDDESTRAIVEQFREQIQRLTTAISTLYQEPTFRPWIDQLGMFG